MIEDKNKIRIAIDISVTPGVAGGIAQSTQGLVSSLGQLDGPEEYLLVAKMRDQADWIGHYSGANQKIVMMPRQTSRNGAVNYRPDPYGIRRVLRPAANAVRHTIEHFSPQSERSAVTVSEGFYEGLGCDVMHFPTQSFVLCALPTIFNPHDLQHLHYPQFFRPKELLGRETSYRAACQFSNTVVVGSEWIKQDIVSQYRVNPDKIQIIPWAPPTAQYPPITPAQIEEARTKLHLPELYALYPAVTWPHKNHLRLFEALAELRHNRGLVVNLICTGARDRAFWPKIEQRINELNLASQVRFLGFLSETDLRVVYRLAQFLVLPSLFEADSCPIHEAWSEGIPVASSNLTGLPDQMGNAGLLFDARDVSAVAGAIQKMTIDADLRRELIERGYRRVKDFDWARTAKAYRAVYRRAAGLRLDEEDCWLLQWDWMREPNKTRPGADLIDVSTKRT
jgi:glycosyltransferase involved in cell wall biosynthesis